MKVLVVSNNSLASHLGGAEVAAAASARALADRGHRVRLLSVRTRHDAATERSVVIEGLPIHEVRVRRRWRNPWLEFFDPRVANTVASEIARERPDVIHAHNLSGTSIAPLLVARRAGIPVVLTLHDSWLLCANNMLLRRDLTLCDPHRASCSRCFRGYDYWAAVPSRRRLLRLATGSVARFVSPSQRLVELHAAAGYPRTRFTVLRHGLPWLASGPPPIDQTIGNLHRRWRTVALVGALTVNKGVDVLVDAIHRLLASEPRLHLLVAGKGDRHLEERIRGLGPAATLVGPVDRARIASIYSGATLTAVPSTGEENSPITICESLMAGTPVVASRIGGIPELVEEGATGWLVRHGDPDALAEAIRHHLALPAARIREMRRAAVGWARRELAPERHARSLEALLIEATRDRRHALVGSSMPNRPTT